MKAILKKMDLIVNLKGFASVLLGVGMLVSSQGAWGQDAPAQEVMQENITIASSSESSLSSQLPAVGLPVGVPNPVKEEDPKNSSDYGKPENKKANIVLPPLKGFRQLADAQPIQAMYKDLINKQVPVLIQTMMMVENGAATGFIGSMNMVSNLMNNTIQTQQFQLELMNLTDDTGQMKEAYAGALKKAFEATTSGGSEATSWPAAIYIATADRETEAREVNDKEKGKIATLPNTNEPFTQISSLNVVKTTAASTTPGKEKIQYIKDMLIVNEAPAGGLGGVPNLLGGTPGPSHPGPESYYKNKKIEALIDEVTATVGDFKIELEDTGKGGVARGYKITYEKPTEQKNGQWGLSNKARKETEKVWKNLNDLMNKLCTFKRTNENNNLEPIAKKTAATSGTWPPEMWKDASAPDIVITQNILEQIFLVSRQSKDLNNLDCNAEFPPGDENQVPFEGKFADADAKNPDLCKIVSSKVTPCLRFQVLYNMASIIGTSRALHTYDILEHMMDRFAKDPVTQELNKRLFKELLGDGAIGTEIDKNRDRWAALTLYMARYTQGQQGSGGTFKPGGSNAITGQGGGYGDSAGGK